ncbi:MAG: sugar ABC transporter ATP-binding protein [Verrucomicrobia bacterium Tous-C9LFEB]|nr:MAG: sugar ABC transporter ATP-binding protein [Verrucomicrobia bacterium Tous-C9LFEB]
MAKVVIENLYKIYPGEKGKDVTAVDNANLVIQDREFVVLVGPSGCGKSTTLRMIAGLEDITRGDIFIDDVRVNDVPPKDRDIAMVFQNYALYPHMTVYKNMAFGLELRKFPKAEIDKRVRDAAAILGLTDDMLERKPKALSGGQRQRVAVGRAIVRKPKVFLFDEPLSNLDAKMRVQMRTEISKLHTRLATTMIYVTHDQVEAMTMGDRIVVMKDGVIQQQAAPLEIYNTPANAFVAGFIGSPAMNFLNGTIVEKGGELYFAEDSTANGALLKLEPEQARKADAYLGRPVIFGIRPEDLQDRLYVVDSDPGHTFRVTVEVIEPMGAETYLYLTTGAHSLISRSQVQLKVEVNSTIELVANIKRAHLFDAARKSDYTKPNGEFDADKWHAACPLIF